MARMELPVSSSDILAALTPIWQSALQRSPVGVEDNFFDLGGDPAAAARIFSEVAKAGGPNLPPFVIFQTPTLASMASFLTRAPHPQFSPLVALKPGAAGPPVFITHGIAGHLMEFFELVRHTSTSQPIYGMQTRGMDGVTQPFDRIEDMAEYFLGAVKSIQPHGPYFLIGYSLGGLVTLEMARRLSESGERIALLALLDSYPHRTALSWPQRTHLLARLTKHHLASAARRLLPALSPSRAGATEDWREFELLYPAMRPVRECSALALARYRPRYYPGTIRFVRAEVSTVFPADPLPVWGPLVKEFVGETAPGDHHGILKAHFRELASILSRYLQETRK
ncbi:MAG TPA: alpha/beta fold hydrolase [Verrucomicrobiae bacterium]|nr:alpha/beta fold hydrolase [Verrucomicrobiae bacterium]